MFVSLASRVTLGCLIAGGLALGQSVTGTVVDLTGTPVPGAAIAITGGPGPVFSNERGEFGLNPPPGRVELTVSHAGFVRDVRWVEAPVSLEPIVLVVAPARDAITVRESSDYLNGSTTSGTKTLSVLRDVPQSISIVNQVQMQDQMMMSIADVVRYIPGITSHQGENNRDQLIIRGNSTSADFFVNGVRDDVQYYRDLYNLDRVEALKGPNALIFGRGGAGGVINRVTKEAGFTPLREFTLEGGAFDSKRFSTDLEQPFNDKLALRFNGMYETSGSFRDFVSLQRYGISPTLTWNASPATKVAFSYENFHDARTADRGISSFNGLPLDLPISTYIGNPADSHVRAAVNLGSVLVEHQFGRLNIRNRAQIGNYDRGYQNYVPGVVSADKSLISLSAYNNATARLNLFNQTDLTYTMRTGALHHTLLGGLELGRQLTGNFRNTGYFNGTATAIQVPYADPTLTTTTAAFRQSATDADNHLKLNLGAAYVQDQIQLSRFVQLVAGARFDHFDLQYLDNRTGTRLRRIDNLVSPRAGLVFKPITAISLYSSYSVSFLPSSGDQFSSLTTVTQQVKPERFTNYEVGAKWELRRGLSLTSAAYRLDRTNTRSTDPNNPAAIVQTGSQRSNGFEAGLQGSITRSWKVAGGYGYQDAFVTGATTAAVTGAQVAMVPHHMFSLWNSCQLTSRVGGGLGLVNRTDMFAAVDDTVRLPGYTRLDAAVYVRLTERLRLQVNAENLTDRRYFANADSNYNISPGSPRAVRAGLVLRF